MLVLSRRIGEVIVLDDHVAIGIVEVRGTQVKLAIIAPRSVNVVRSELVETPFAKDAKREVEGAAAFRVVKRRDRWESARESGR